MILRTEILIHTDELIEGLVCESELDWKDFTISFEFIYGARINEYGTMIYTKDGAAYIIRENYEHFIRMWDDWLR